MFCAVLQTSFPQWWHALGSATFGEKAARKTYKEPEAINDFLEGSPKVLWPNHRVNITHGGGFALKY